ncbi:carboxypeptidase regulatory-like domain-containing protein, partial [Planctomycetota bacterium]
VFAFQNSIELRIGSETQNVDFRLERGAAIVGTVTDETGRPLERAYIDLLALDTGPRSLPMTRPLATSDKQGGYRIGGLRAGRYQAAAKMDGRPPSIPVIVEVPEVGEAPCYLEVPMGLPIKGIVVGPEGEPVHGAEIMTSTGHTSKWHFASFVRRRASTDREGRFALEGLPEGSYRVQILAAPHRYIRTTVTDVAAGEAELRIVLEMAGQIKGTVLARGTGEAIQQAWVQAVVADGSNRTWHGVNGTTGSFQLFALKPGTYTVRAKAANHGTDEIRGVVVAAGATAEVELTLEPQ